MYKGIMAVVINGTEISDGALDADYDDESGKLFVASLDPGARMILGTPLDKHEAGLAGLEISSAKDLTGISVEGVLRDDNLKVEVTNNTEEVAFAIWIKPEFFRE